MEENFEYQVKPAPTKETHEIEGVAEIKATILAWQCYDQGRKEYWDGIRDTMPQEPKEGVQEVERRYPRAAVYLVAEEWVDSRIPILIRLGKQAQERLQDGEDHNTVLEDMLSRYDVFKMAQEG